MVVARTNEVSAVVCGRERTAHRGWWRTGNQLRKGHRVVQSGWWAHVHTARLPTMQAGPWRLRDDTIEKLRHAMLDGVDLSLMP